MAASALAAVNTDASPNLGNLETWLKRLPADSCSALNVLREHVQVLAANSIGVQERFAMLERMRAYAARLMPEQRRRYMGKPVPFDGDERQTWEDGVRLWEAFYFGYAACAESAASPGPEVVWHRALDCLGRAVREHTYAYRAVPKALWKELNSCYRSVEACTLSDLPVEDAEQPGSQLSCKRAYLTTVLHDAANLYALSSTQMQALEQLLPSWLAATDLSIEIPSEATRSPLAIDLCGESGPQLSRTLQPAESLRYLDMSKLAPTLRELAAAVRAGTLPLEFAATRTLERAATERLLTHLYIQWCSAGSSRVDERHGSQGRAQVALNMHAIHFQVSGRAFRQPGLRYTVEEQHDLATFGHITGRTEQRLLTGRSSALEPWEIENRSASGVLIMVRKPDIESRIEHGQLLAMRTSGIDPVLLAQVQRLRIEQDGSLSIGVRAVRSPVHAVAVRPLGDPALKYERALMVEADTERNVPAYLVLPPGKFALGAVFELHAARLEKAIVTGVLDQSTDNDRVTYKIA
jgi:hypothetical protein